MGDRYGDDGVGGEYNGDDLLVSEGFNTNSYSMIIDALQEAIEELRKLKDPAEASA